MVAFVPSIYHTLLEQSDRAFRSNIEFILSFELIARFVFYYFASYELYFSVFLAIGSLCNTLKEAPSMLMIMIQLVSLAMMVFVVCNPDSTIVRIMLWLPLFTPHLMMNRAAADPPVIDVVGTTICYFLASSSFFGFPAKSFEEDSVGADACPQCTHCLVSKFRKMLFT